MRQENNEDAAIKSINELANIETERGDEEGRASGKGGGRGE